MNDMARRKFESLVQLADFRVMRWNERRKIEARMSLAFWGVILAPVAVIHGEMNMHVLFWFLFVSVFVHASMCCMPISVRNHKDISCAFYYMERAEDVLDGVVNVREKSAERQYLCALKDWWVRLEIVVSVMLSMAVFFYFYNVSDYGVGSAAHVSIYVFQQ